MSWISQCSVWLRSLGDVCRVESPWSGISFIAVGSFFAYISQFGIGYSKTGKPWTPEAQGSTLVFGISLACVGVLILLLRLLANRTDIGTSRMQVDDEEWIES